MSTILKRFAVPIGIALAFLVAILIVQSSEAFNDCIEDAQYKAAQTSHPKQISDVPVTFVMRERCWGNYVHRYSDGIIALFTVILAGSTIALWQVTNKSALVAERALTELERPFVFFHKIQTNFPSYYNLIFDPDRSTPEFFLTIVNYGRTPANFDQGAIFYEVNVAVPDEFVPPEQIQLGSPHSELAEIIIGPDREYRFPSQRIRHVFTAAHCRGVFAGKFFLYCHGFITYHDIFGEVHTTKFCRRYDAGRDEWLPDGGKERNNAN